MAPRWIRHRAYEPGQKGPEWFEDDWVLVDDQGEILARTYRLGHGPQAGRWFWALSAWGGHSGVADGFEAARIAVKARLQALGLA